jgi:Nucleotidyl transferase AbiEii toxin, Type IV TA system
VGDSVIPEPQRTYVLELLQALGPIADDFVVAGAQAMKFMLRQARATKDIDFVLDAVSLRGQKESVAQTLQKLGYSVVPGSQNFQFQKAIPGSKEVMRIEFMAPEELKRKKDFRVDVQNGIHARACTGGTIAIAESSIYELSGKLPDGSDYSASIRVTKPHALVMLKLLALDDRYRNIRGPAEARHDREEARTHAADIVAILSVQPDPKSFLRDFEKQFIADLALGVRVLKISNQYFRSNTSPGLLVYEEYLVGDKPLDRAARSRLPVGRRSADGELFQVRRRFQPSTNSSPESRIVATRNATRHWSRNSCQILRILECLYILRTPYAFSLPASLAERSIAVTNLW